LDTRLSDGCQVEQIHVLRQHDSRYSTSTRSLLFPNTWSLRLNVDSLVSSGSAGEYQSGTDFWNKYERILYNAQPYYSEIGRRKPLQRNYESVVVWASISYGNESNNSLYGAFVCCNLFVPSALNTNLTHINAFVMQLLWEYDYVY